MPELPMWAWIAALAGGGLAIGSVAYAANKQKPAAPLPPVSPVAPPLPPVTPSVSNFNTAVSLLTGNSPDPNAAAASAAAAAAAAEAAFIIPPQPVPFPAIPGQVQVCCGYTLTPGTGLPSANGQYQFVLQADGNLVLYAQPGTRDASRVALWASGTNGKAVTRAVMQSDGNFVLYNGSMSVAASGTNDHPMAYLVVQNDGNVVIYAGPNNTSPVWASNTVFGETPAPAW